VFKARTQTARHHVVIHYVGEGGNPCGTRDTSSLGGTSRVQRLVTGTPEEGTGVMNEIAHGRIAPGRRMLETGAGIPDPLAGSIGASGSGAHTQPAAHRYGQARQHAGDAPAKDDVLPADGRLRVLVTGGRGLIGRNVVAALRGRGHEVILATREGAEGGPALDFTQLPAAAELATELIGIDVIVNAVGIFRESGKQSFDALHVKAPLRMLEAAKLAGVHRFIQISTLGADAASPVRYFASKGQADEYVQASAEPAGIVVRPSLVFDPSGPSTRWFAMLAVLPVTPLPEGGRQHVQPVHVDDLAAVVARLVVAGHAGQRVDAVGPRALALRDYLQHFKQALGSGRVFATLPSWLARAAASMAGWWPRAPFDRDALRMLEGGNVAAADTMRQWRGRPLRDPADFIEEATGVRVTAWLSWLLPAMRITLAAMWVVTALVSLWGYPRDGSLALLARTGLHGEWAIAALWSAALLDLALGLAMLRARWRPVVYGMQALLVAAYTVMITLWLPEQWLHPYGPVLKNLPLLAMIACLWALDRRDGPDPR
jgi:uncharacterized protein YbjT (DUF2867 family)